MQNLHEVINVDNRLSRIVLLCSMSYKYFNVYNDYNDNSTINLIMIHHYLMLIHTDYLQNILRLVIVR